MHDPEENGDDSLSGKIKDVKDAAMARAHDKTHALFEKEKKAGGRSDGVKESSVMHWRRRRFSYLSSPFVSRLSV
jgi:hypothetical protein